MSDVARSWAAAQDAPSRTAKEVLKTLAQWADAEGEVWAYVGVIALEMQCQDRTVQRGLAQLRACGLVIDTGEKKLHRGRSLPIYQLPVETGFANIRQRMAAEKAAAEAVDKGAMGDSGVTPRGVTRGDMGCHGRHPMGDSGDTPRGDSGDTQIGNEITQGLTPLACERASGSDDRGVDDPHRRAACAAWARKAPERVGPERVAAAWAEATARSGWSSERMAAAVSACVARDPDFDRGKAMNLDRWLGERRYEAWDVETPEAEAGSAKAARPAWCGPDEVRDAVAGAMGPGGVVSYLDPAGWDDGRRVILARTGYAERQLGERAGRALEALGVGVERAHG